MKLNSIKEVDNLLLGRKRVSYFLDYPDKTPSKDEVKAMIAKDLNSKEDLIRVKHIYPRFGITRAKVIAHVYKKLEDFKKFEKIKVKKGDVKKDTPKEVKEAPKEAKVEEKKEVKEKVEEKPKENEGEKK